MIHHCVFLNFQHEYDRHERDQILSALARLVDEVPGFVSLTFGPNADFEHMSEHYSDGFVAIFDDRESLAEYAAHPTHVELGRRLVANCVGGLDGLIVFDIVST